MAVDGLEAVGVAEDHVVSVALTLKVGEAHAAAESSVDGVAGAELQIHALVLAAETRTVAVRRGDISRAGHGEVAHVDILEVGHCHAGVGVDAARVPSLGVDIELRFLLVFEEVVEKILSVLYRDLVADIFLTGNEVVVFGLVGRGESVALLGLYAECGASGQCKYCECFKRFLKHH